MRISVVSQGNITVPVIILQYLTSSLLSSWTNNVRRSSSANCARPPSNLSHNYYTYIKSYLRCPFNEHCELVR